MTETTTGTVWLTQSKFDQLTEELETLKTRTRAEVVQRVSDARDEGDLKENAGYHAAREELGQIDGRIAQLAEMLERAQVGEKPADDGTVSAGMLVKVRLLGVDLEQEFLFGAREMAGDDVTVYSPQSPLGQAIDGVKVGDTVTYELPNGKSQQAEVLSATPYDG